MATTKGCPHHSHGEPHDHKAERYLCTLCVDAGCSPYAPLTTEEWLAVSDYALRHGRTWKEKLRGAWLNASEPGLLQKLRNSHGPTWLQGFALPENDG